MNQHKAFLNEVREDRSDLARVLQKHKGIRRIVQELYPDNAHFIYELLQNAEDKGATKASFTLKTDRLVFEHNGESFSEDDVWGITDIGEGTKTTDKEMIGCFGIGFKAVFAYTDSPEIYSPTFCFRIKQLVLPSELPNDSSIGAITRFEFPFNSIKKPPENALKEIKTSLDELSQVTLLFLSCLNEICWGDSTIRRIPHSGSHFEVRKECSGRIVDQSHFLRFSELVPGLNKQFVRLAFPLQFTKDHKEFTSQESLRKQMRIVAAERGLVAVSFPCAKETSGLRFHLHAPFVPELSRASVKETATNDPLFYQLAKLSSSSLHTIRELGLLTAEFLGVLPNSHETLSERYGIFRDAIINEMNSESLTPTFRKDHAPASRLLQGKAALKSLLNRGDLRVVMQRDDHESFDWAVGASQKNSLQDNFLSSLDVTTWGFEDLMPFLETCVVWPPGEPNEPLVQWLQSKSDEWMQEFYAALYAEVEPEAAFSRFSRIAIVKRSEGTLGLGCESYFSSDGIEHDSTLPRVVKGVYTSGQSKKQQESAKCFLSGIGVREVGEAEEIEAILTMRYDGDEIEPKESDLKRFVALVESEPKTVELFTKRSIFERNDGGWAKPSQIYLDAPIQETGLSAYYEAWGDAANRFPLAARYSSSSVSAKRLAQFAKAVGAQTDLEPERSPCDKNPDWQTNLQCAPGKRPSDYSLDIDFQIPRLRRMLESPSMALSRLVWNTMSGLKSEYLQAEYRVNRNGGSRTAKSLLAHTLTNASWIPQEHGRDIDFVKPLDASVNNLPEGFPYDRGKQWLNAIGFGCGEQRRQEQQTQEQRQKHELANKVGVPLEKLEQLQECERAKVAFDKRLSESVPGSNRRNEKLADRATTGKKRQSEARPRQTRIGRVDSDEVFQYLSSSYCLEDRWHCQMCREPMSFRKRDGTDCREKRELFNGRWAAKRGLERGKVGKNMKPLPECVNLHLVLCPLCNSFYNEYVFLVDGQQTTLLDWIRDEDSDENIFVIKPFLHTKSTESDRELNFHRKHLSDIRACLPLEEVDGD